MGVQGGDRAALESAVVADVQALSAESEHIGRVFAGAHHLSANDFRALVHIMVAENRGSPLTAGELRTLMGVSGAAITYLVERMISSGHIRRESDPHDRRKVILRYADHGMTVARAFFTPLASHTHEALAGLTDEDLAGAHRVFSAVLEAMHTFRADLDADLSD
jgi:DNA-binding MarR family transcriptional regulator